MQVWVVEIDQLDCDTPGWMSTTTEAICIDENRALQYAFEQTGRWLTDRKNGCLCETINGKEWSIAAVGVLDYVPDRKVRK